MRKLIGMRARAMAGRRIWRTGSAECRCSGVDARHILLTDDGLAAWREVCECFTKALQEGIDHADKQGEVDRASAAFDAQAPGADA